VLLLYFFLLTLFFIKTEEADSDDDSLSDTADAALDDDHDLKHEDEYDASLESALMEINDQLCDTNFEKNRGPNDPFCDFIKIVERDKVNYEPLSSPEVALLHEKYTKPLTKGEAESAKRKGQESRLYPSIAGYEYQRFLIQYYDDAENYFQFNKKRGVNIHSDVIFHLHHYALTEKLSVSAAENLITMVSQQILKKYVSPEDCLEFPSYRTIKKRINKNIHNIIPIRIISMRLPRRFFGDTVTNAHRMSGRNSETPLRPTTSAFCDIMPLIFKSLLDIDPDEWNSFPTNSYEDLVANKTVLFTNFMSGKLAAEYSQVLRKIHGENAVCVMISVYFDQTQVNSTLSVDAKPLSIMILNAHGKSLKNIFVGLIPPNLAYDTAELQAILTSRGRTTNAFTLGHLTKIITMTKRQMQRNFVYEMLKPLLIYEKHGLYGLVGRGPKQKLHLMFVHIAQFILDTPDRDLMSGTCFLNDTSKCALCMCSDCNTAKVSCSPIKWRKDVQTNNAGLKLDASLLEEFEQRGKSKLKKWVRTANNVPQRDLESQKDFIQKCKQENMSAGFNQCHNLFKFPREHGMDHGFFKSMLVDYLHVFLKGFVQETIVNTLTCVEAIGNKQNFPKTSFLRGLAKVDQRISDFLFLQTSHLTRFVRFGKGISAHMSAEGGSQLTGGLETYKYPSILVQVMFSIAQTEPTSILPTDSNWYKDNVINATKSSTLPSWRFDTLEPPVCNIYQVIRFCLNLTDIC